MENNPKVFISYAHKNQAYEDKVLELANRLRSEGIDAMIDQYEEAPPEGWPRWMEHQIMESEFVLVYVKKHIIKNSIPRKRGRALYGRLTLSIKCYMIQRQKQINLLRHFLMMLINSIYLHR